MPKHTLSAVFLIIVSGMIAAGDAKTIRVPDDYASIQKAINDAGEGDTVFVANGTYREGLQMQYGVCLIGEDPDKTVIRGNRGKPVIRGASRAVVKNLTLQNGSIGILCENTDMLIERNIIKENDATGIQCLITLPTIRNNIIAGNKWSGIFCELISQGMRSAIEHNVIAENGHSGISLNNNSTVLIRNNVLFSNKKYGILVSQDSRRSRIIYNDLYANRRAYNSHAVLDQTNISENPNYPSVAWTSFAFMASYDSPLRGLGKDGAPIGLISEDALAATQTDSDGDGVPDKNDLCPEGDEDYDGFEDDDGCPDYDNDFDGLYDSQDECPDEAEDFDGFEDKNGCPDLDNDGDGIPDQQDKCPNKPETENGYKDDDGCPDQKPM
ncbi:MAG: right-handed parallel beta-helix repeat-containing protein [Chitinivibrionales bacterium]